MVAEHSIGWRIQTLRSQHNVTQLELGAALDLSTSALRKLEYSQTLPSLKTLEKLSDFFHVSIDFLVRGVDSGGGNLDVYRETGLNDAAIAYLKEQMDIGRNCGGDDEYIAALNTVMTSNRFYALLWRLRGLNEELTRIDKDIGQCKAGNAQPDELLRVMQLGNELRSLLEEREFLKWLYMKEVQGVFDALIVKGDDE